MKEKEKVAAVVLKEIYKLTKYKKKEIHYNTLMIKKYM